MKTLYILTAVLLVVTLTSMMPEEQKSSQQAQASSMEENQPMFHKGMITFKVKEGAGEFVKQDENVSFNIASLDAKASRYKVDLIDKRFRYNPNKLKKDMPDLSRIYRIEFPEEISVTKVAREFSKDPNIEYAEPIPVNYLMVEPNDPMYVQQQHLPQIFAPEAWNIHKGENGEEEVVIAIVDSGVDWDPEDLVENIWQNMGEDVDGDGRTIEFIGGEWVLDPDDENGIDDDGNGYVDDFIGWNFFYFNNDPNPVPGIPDNDHGTHCAGIASATTDNNVGVAGIGWNLKILAIESGLNISIHHCYDAIIYAAENGADVISNSWSAHIYAQANHEAITYATGLGSIIVAAAGNHNYFSNFYPADYPGVVSVAAVQPNDHKASFSNYGPNIWVSAPGTGILSTLPNNTYQSWSGTSMATPLVAGLLGLVKSYHPEWTSSQVITQVLGTADDIDQVNPGFENLLGSGRINAFHALDSSGVTLDQEISLDLVNSTCYDDDNDQMLEPGDVVNMSIKLRNYNFGIGASNATFTLLCNDPDITISNNSCSADIPADDYFNLEHVFEFQISEQATTHLAVLKLITTADVEITWGDTISLEIPVAPEGILVFQGEGTGNAFSGEYINDCLSEQGFQVYYTSHFPFSFNGFDAVFMSYGNYGDRIDDGVIVTFEMTEVMTEYLLDGGYIYAECGSFFGGMAYVGYPNLPEMLELFGVDELEVSTSSQNPINLLTGLSGSVGEELVFDGSTQSPNWYIDKYTPNENGVAAFEEDGYGTVAVQGEGEYGQKTFCFAYALAHLVDGDPPNTRDTLLARIINFFELEPETPNNFINIPEDYPTIQQGIDVADEGDTVLVAPGTYVENINFSGKNITVASHFLTTNDTAYISQTIIDGDSITSVVVFENGEDSSAVLNGFTLTKGSGTVIPWPIGPGTYGGGIYISASRPSISNSIIRGNYADNGGGIYSGGLYPDSSNATLLNVTLKLNSANDFGGGLYIGYGSHITLVDSKIEENSANSGGGVCCGMINPDFKNVTVTGNVARNGGGIFFSSPIVFGDNIDRCNIYKNYALLGNDLYSEVDVEIKVDTFSVLNPTEYHACPVENFEFDVLNGMIEQADADLFVSTSGDNSNSGLSVAEPLQNIRFAFSKMLAGETNPHTIHIADGIYSHSATGEVYPLNIPEYISLYGESELGTVLDGEWLTAVMRIISNSTSQIENLTVTNGVGGSESTGGGTAPYYWAGGVTLHDHSDLLIKNVSVVGNSSGIYCTSASSPTIENVTIDGNEGTGLYCKWSCNADISFSTITNNLGSGIACSNSDPNIQDVTITGNTGSGVWCFDVSSPLLKNVLISNNEGGMDCSNGCFPYLENVTICYNTTVNGNGGGIYCRYSASPVFDTVNRCNIYMNQAAFAQDYYAEVEQNVVVDTFTVINPSSYQAFPRHLFNFDILNSKTELVDADLYVSPDGDNSNSGISGDEALKNIDYAFSMIMADSSHQNTIHLLDGIYSPSTNEESFPVYMLDYVNLMGASKEGVILDAEGQSTVLSIKNNISNHISNLTISGGDGNHSNPDNQAGGISIWNSSIWLNDISVQDNTSGGISILWVSCPLLENISVVNNGDVWRGGGIFISGNGCNPVLKNVLIAENQAEHVGGGIYISSHADPTFINVTLSNNSATQGNGGIYSESFNDPEIFNSIIWDNDPPELFGSFTITCSDIQGGWQGEGNIDEDPLFIGSGAHPYALLDESPCINTGTTDTTGLNLPELDLAGNPRIYGGRIDMGAYENQSVSTLIQNPQSSNLNLICSPNPFTEELTITWNQTESAHTTIEIYNSAGKRIETRVSEIFSEGDHQLNWNTNSIPPGIYFLRMQTENETVKQKIIKL